MSSKPEPASTSAELPQTLSSGGIEAPAAPAPAAAVAVPAAPAVSPWPGSEAGRVTTTPSGYSKMSLETFLEIDDGPPRVASLLPAHGTAHEERSALPLMLYLPGIDGSGLAASRQFPLLLKKFDMRTLVTPPGVSLAGGGR